MSEAAGVRLGSLNGCRQGCLVQCRGAGNEGLRAEASCCGLDDGWEFRQDARSLAIDGSVL